MGAAATAAAGPQRPSPAAAAAGALAAAAPPPSLPQPAALPPLHGSGRSTGTPQHGALDGGCRVDETALLGIEVLPPTVQRSFVWGTPTLVRLLVDTAAVLVRDAPDRPLRLGNLSRVGGGDIGPSVSHNSGRDVDIQLFARHADDSPARPGHFVRFDASGLAQDGTVFFDTERNWLLVRQLLSHPVAIVQWIFIAEPLRRMLLDHALRRGEPDIVRDRARRVLVEPRDSSPHDDHMHVRIACPASDRPACIDGPGRTALARAAQIESLLEMYRHGSPAEQRYAREILSLSDTAGDELPAPIEGPDTPSGDDASDKTMNQQ